MIRFDDKPKLTQADKLVRANRPPGGWRPSWGNSEGRPLRLVSVRCQGLRDGPQFCGLFLPFAGVSPQFCGFAAGGLTDGAP
jgi:hypothetical protein